MTLPEGVQVNPAAANGLQACSQAAIGYEHTNAQTGTIEFEPEEAKQRTGAEEGALEREGRRCPKASKLGTVEIETPILSEKLTGSVYLAEPAPNGEAGKNPFGSLIALYIVAENPTLGILVKLAGKGELNEQTGRITTTFPDTPQVPFEKLSLHLFGGGRGSLSTPALCNAQNTTAALFTPWSLFRPGSEPEALIPASSSFAITSGPAGGACPGSPLPFGPSMQAGTISSQAGAFSPFALTIKNPDGDQALTGVTVSLPPGIAGIFANVTPCLEPPPGQEWACRPQSLIGHSIASAGLGEEPFNLPGQVFLTTGYDGAPFGVLVSTPAVAGPFNLGMVNVRERIDVNPNTAAGTITTDPGPRGEGIPTRLKGVPAQIKQIVVSIDRPDFIFNPTDCVPMSVASTLTGSEGASDGLSVPFTATNCATLPFKPTFIASTKGRASKADGASLVVKVTSAGLGQANIAKTTVTLPKALPSRLTTIQKACVSAVFEANPAACDEGSVVGSATIHTPVFKNPLSGPAYLVSHGGAAFPDVEFVLQGEGVKVVLDGKTDIKKGVTTATFESVPDAPFTTFETVLPTGPHSALTANVAEKKHYNLCGTSLVMPTVITGQNGKVIEQSTKVAIQGCKVKKLTRRQKLALALKTCRKKHKHSRGRRALCERRARKAYAAKKAIRSNKH